ncbi:MAG: glycosyltransferase [Desulfuromonadales bacterium]|nr:glycosyltransferase [Desulfuromonadales bacterium]
MVPHKILFVITGLGAGGAEMMLWKLLSRIDRQLFSAEVLSLTRIDALAQKYAEIGIPVDFLGMERGGVNLGEMARLVRVMRTKKADLVQTWMYHADFLGGLGALCAGRVPLIWNLRNSNLDPQTSKKSSIMVARLCARLSPYLPRKIVCCSKVAEDIHVQLGYDRSKMVFIPNGFDLSAFRPDPELRHRFCQEHNIPETSIIVGYAARFDPQKDHKGFIQAAAQVRVACPQAVFILCGDETSWDNPDLCRCIDDHHLHEAFRLLGRRDDMPAITSAFDIAVSASAYGEAFSNAIGEAMACAVPCVVTDVGDSALIVGATGKVVPPRDPQALATELKALIELGEVRRQELGWLARQRVQQEFSLDRVVNKYQDLYKDVLA